MVFGNKITIFFGSKKQKSTNDSKIVINNCLIGCYKK